MKYKRRVYEVEAVQFKGENLEEVATFTDAMVSDNNFEHVTLMLKPKGHLKLNLGDWIVKNENSGFTKMSNEIFEKNYELVEA
ncbi:MAG: hypothetical protein WCR55_07570 [Lentisphaerota bacterium]